MKEHWDKSRILGNLPDAAARRWGQRPALTFKGRRWTFSAQAAEIDRIARGLVALGIQPGEHVLLWLNNCPEWVFLMFALAKIGAVQIPVNTRFRTADLAYVLKQSNSSTLITHDVSGPIGYLDMVRELVSLDAAADPQALSSAEYPHLRRVLIKSEVRRTGTVAWPDLLAAGERVPQAEVDARARAVTADDTVFMMYTSGTTGFPKGVLRNHSFIQNQVDRIGRIGTTEADVFINYLPLFHIFGYVDGPLMSVLTGNHQVLMESFNPDEALDLVQAERGTQVHGFETHLKDLSDAQLRRPRDLSSLRAGIFAVGMQSGVPVTRRAGTVLAPLKTVTAYGMTEVGQNALLGDLNSTEEQRCETSGYPSEGYQVRVVDPQTGADQPHGVQGEFVIKTYAMMQGYYNQPEETAKAFDADGWFHSGDAGYTRADGYVRLLGRYKDMLKVGGENVDPMEVEGHLLTHPGVAKVAVVGFPDERLSEVPVAFVQPVPGAGLTPQAVIDHCKGKIASFKVPRRAVLVEDLPMTATGKIQKARLREEALVVFGRQPPSRG
ncbi:MAG: AMP-binding protein [Candidatus Lambdaproteobacteria bacterium]|nr:AMP-binding protein [Candidatus Lambdaproteobacteria bacterium]